MSVLNKNEKKRFFPSKRKMVKINEGEGGTCGRPPCSPQRGKDEWRPLPIITDHLVMEAWQRSEEACLPAPRAVTARGTRTPDRRGEKLAARLIFVDYLLVPPRDGCFIFWVLLT